MWAFFKFIAAVALFLACLCLGAFLGLLAGESFRSPSEITDWWTISGPGRVGALLGLVLGLMGGVFLVRRILTQHP